MITNCAGIPGLYDLDEPVFIIDVLVLMLLIAPATVGYTLWRMFVSNRTGLGVSSILRLDENAETDSESRGRRISWQTLFLYGLTFGVFAFEAFEYIQDLLT